jgi:hypothetical protein
LLEGNPTSTVQVRERPVAKKKTAGRPPKPGDEGRPVRIAPDIIRSLRFAPEERGGQ